jgi:type I restriction enzyme M protein
MSGKNENQSNKDSFDAFQYLISLGEKNKLLSIKEGRITYLKTGKSYNFQDPEEIVRASFYVKLIDKYKYPENHIDLEVVVPRRTPSDSADIVVYEDDARKNPYIVVECKKESIPQSAINQAIEQVFGNANSLRAKYAIMVAGGIEITFDVAGFDPREREKNTIPSIPVKYGKLPEYKYKRGDPSWDLEKVNFNELSRIFQKCHNIIWAGGKRDPSVAFDEISKMIFTKLYDERSTKNGEFYKFQVGTNENDDVVTERVTRIYEKARATNSTVFKEAINIPADKIFGVVETLQKVSLIHTDLDAKGRAFEQFLGKIFRGELGQYFTRREIVEFMVNMVNPKEDDLILDPACGSGGFLLYSMKQVISDIDEHYKGDSPTIVRKKYDFSHYNVYGVEINDKIARVAMMDMIIHDDGHSNIEYNTALNSKFENPNIKDEVFTLILTNPPFGDRVVEGDKDKLGHNKLKNFELAGEKLSQRAETLFIERCYNFLAPDGHLAIVLPDGILNNPSDFYVRDFIKNKFEITAIVTLPEYAFRKAGSGMRTSLLFLRKLKANEKANNNRPVFMAVAEHIGYDATGRPDNNELPEILEDFTKNIENKDGGRYWIKIRDFVDRIDPTYYHLGYLIEKHLKQVKYDIVSLKDILAEPLTSGKSPKGGVKYSIGDIPSITIGNMIDTGDFNLDELNYVSSDFYETRKKKLQLKTYDILVAKDGATTGKTSIISEEFPYADCIFTEHIFRLRIDVSKANPLYVFYFLHGALGQMQLKRQVSGGAQGGITKEFVDATKIPIPPLKVQEQIVDVANIKRKEANRLTKQAKDKFVEVDKELEQMLRS